MREAFSRAHSPDHSDTSYGRRGVHRVAAILIIALALAGCSKFRDAYRVDSAFYFGSEQNKIDGTNEVDTETVAEDFKPVDLETYIFPGSDGRQTAYNEARNDKKSRKRLQTILLRMSDKVCDQHKGAIVADAAFFNMGLSFGATVLSGASAIVGGEAAKSVLAGLASMTTAGQSVLNEQVYRQKMAELIVVAIDLSREAVTEKIATKWENAGGENYTTDEAIRDAYLYHRRCSFFHGIQKIAQKLEEKGIDKNTVLARAALIREEIKKNLAHYKELTEEARPGDDDDAFTLASKNTIANQATLTLDTITGLQLQLKNLNFVLQISQ